MTGPLATVTERARARATATRDYHTAILAARAAGHTLAAIAQAAGVTRQAIHEMIRRHEGGEPRNSHEAGYDWPRNPWKD